MLIICNLTNFNSTFSVSLMLAAPHELMATSSLSLLEQIYFTVKINAYIKVFMPLPFRLRVGNIAITT